MQKRNWMDGSIKQMKKIKKGHNFLPLERRMHVLRTCLACKKEFNAVRKERKYCSKRCFYQYRRSRGGYPIDYKIDKNGCFVCVSHKPGKRGYPRMHNKLVFRHVFEEMFEPLEPNQIVRHLCDNKMCINPEHLRKGTQKENIQDALRNGRFPIGSERSYAKLDELKAYGIKVLIKHGKLTNSEIEHITGIPKDLVKSVKQGKSWKHVILDGEGDNLVSLSKTKSQKASTKTG